jgi:hypothetical protein
MKILREVDIEKYFVKRVKELGGWQRKFVSPNTRGVPDRVVKLGHWKEPLFVELKAPGCFLRLDQLREHARMKKVGMDVLLIQSMEQVDALLW